MCRFPWKWVCFLTYPIKIFRKRAILTDTTKSDSKSWKDPEEVPPPRTITEVIYAMLYPQEECSVVEATPRPRQLGQLRATLTDCGSGLFFHTERVGGAAVLASPGAC